MTRALPSPALLAKLVAVLAVTALTSARNTIAAQELPRPAVIVDCDPQLLFGPPPDTLSESWRSLYPSTRGPGLLALLHAGQWFELVDSVRTSFDQSVASFLGGSTVDPRIARMRIRLDSLRELVTKLERITSVSELAGNSDALRQVGRDVFRPRLSDGAATFFGGSAEEIRLTDEDAVALRRIVCYHAATVSYVMDRFTLDARAFATGVLEAKERRWESYFDRGYSQLPWELYLNSRRARNAGVLDPPTRQMILLHPSVAVQVAGASWRNLARHDAIAIEPLGFIWYRNEYRDYFGLSSAVVFAEGVGTSIGPFLHFGRVAKMGYVFPIAQKDNSIGSRPGGVLVSFDLYKYLSDQAGQARTVMQALRTRTLGSQDGTR